MLHIFNALYRYHYERSNRTELIKLFDFTLEKTDFKSLVLSEFSFIEVITDMNLRSEVIISSLREYLKNSNITYYVPIAQALITIAGDDPNIYFRFCTKCNERLISKKALQCNECGFKWYICPRCGKKWIRDTSNCSECNYSIYG